MKKLSKHLSALVLTLMFVISMCIPAFATSSPAAGANSTTFTNDSVATVVVGVGDKDGLTNGGDKLEAYKVIDVTLTKNNTLDYAFTGLFGDFQDDTTFGADYAGLTVKQYIALESNGTALKTLLGQFAAFVKQNGKTADMTATATEDGVATFASVDPGQYIILGDGTSKGAKVYQTVTAEVVPVVVDGTYVLYDTYEVKMKTTTPSIDKEITDGTVMDGDKPTMSIGDTVSYKLTVALPVFPEGSTNTTFYVGDLLSKGLTLNGDSFTVKAIAGETSITLDKDSHYTLDTTGDANHSFYMDFDMSKLAGYEGVIIEYTATLNDQAAIGTVGEANPNTVDLVWSNSPFDGNTWKPGEDRPGNDKPGYGHDDSKKVVYTYALAIDKFEEKMPWEKLAGATFELYDNKDCQGTPITTLTTNEEGQAFFVGLKAGTYWLKETVAPSGFNLLDHYIEVKLDQNEIPYSVTTTTTHTEYVYTANVEEALVGYEKQATDLEGNLLYLTADGKVTTEAGTNNAAYIQEIKETVGEEHTVISNNPDVANGYYLAGVANSTGAHLPSTGGIGTTIFYVVGGLLVLGAAILLITKRRMAATKG